MATKLKNLVITKVALVDEGSCSAAHIKLYKRKDEGGNQIMGYEEILKSLTPEQRATIEAEVTKAKGAICPDCKKPMADCTCKDKLKTDLAAAELAKTASMDEVENLKKQINGGTQTDEEILKSANLDPAVKAMLERSIAKSKAAEIAIVKMKEEQDNAMFIAKAKEVAFVPEAEVKVTALLKSINGVAGATDAVMEILKSVNTVIAKGGTFKEIGGGDSNTVVSSSDEAWAVIEKAASSLVMKGNVSKEKAIEMVISTQPELYNAYTTALKSE